MQNNHKKTERWRVEDRPVRDTEPQRAAQW